MEPVRSSLLAGVVAAFTLIAVLTIADLSLAGSNVLVLSTFRSLCAFGGEPYCDPGSATAIFFTVVGFVLLFAVTWPLLFGVFTWELPGDSGYVHGVLFSLVLWLGVLVVVFYDVGGDLGEFANAIPVLGVMLLAYVLYGVVLGGTYDHLSQHRDFRVSL